MSGTQPQNQTTQKSLIQITTLPSTQRKEVTLPESTLNIANNIEDWASKFNAGSPEHITYIISSIDSNVNSLSAKQA